MIDKAVDILIVSGDARCVSVLASISDYVRTRWGSGYPPVELSPVNHGQIDGQILAPISFRTSGAMSLGLYSASSR